MDPKPVAHNTASNGREKGLRVVQYVPRARVHQSLYSNVREMSRACHRETGHGLKIRKYGSYRSRALQSSMRRFPWLYGVIKINGKYITQKPVGYSTHGWGDALDVESNSLAFMLRFGPAWGWHRTISGDIFHFEYTGHLVGNKPPHGK